MTQGRHPPLPPLTARHITPISPRDVIGHNNTVSSGGACPCQNHAAGQQQHALMSETPSTHGPAHAAHGAHAAHDGEVGEDGGDEDGDAQDEDGGGDAQDEDGDAQDEDGGDALSHAADTSLLQMAMRARRRARSLPVPAAHEPLLARLRDGRKRVMFADTLGLNLASVKHFSAADEPRVPAKVFSRLRSFPPRDVVDELSASLAHSRLHADRLVVCFPEPARAAGFSERVTRLRVSLETVTVRQFDLRGHVRVLAGGRGGVEVGVRYTFNDWLSHVDAQALPAPAGQDALPGERFGFTVHTPPVLEPGSAVQLAVYARSDQGEFWDNNGGQNFMFRYRRTPRAAFEAP